MSKTSAISDRTWLGKQSWNREIIEMMTDNAANVTDIRVRYTVHVDSYDFQSWAKAEVWKDMAWSAIHKIPGQALKTRASYVDPKVKPSAFDADITELRSVTKKVLL